MGLMMWFVKKLSGLSMISGPILKMAQDSDDEVPFRMPVFQTLTRAFVLRDNNTLLLMKAEQLAKDVYSLENEIEDTKHKLNQRKYYLDELEKKRVAAATREKSLIDKYKKKVVESGGTLPGEAAPGFGAASSSAAGPSSSNLGAGGVEATIDEPSGSGASSSMQAGWSSSAAQPLLSSAAPQFTGSDPAAAASSSSSAAQPPPEEDSGAGSAGDQ